VRGHQQAQLALGAFGVCCATTAECELMVNAACGACSTPASRRPEPDRTHGGAGAPRPDITGVLDDPITADALEEALGAAHAKMNVMSTSSRVLRDRDASPAKMPCAWRRKGSVEAHEACRHHGLSAALHTRRLEARRRKSTDDVAGMLDTVAQCGKPAAIEIVTAAARARTISTPKITSRSYKRGLTFS